MPVDLTDFSDFFPDLPQREPIPSVSRVFEAANTEEEEEEKTLMDRMLEGAIANSPPGQNPLDQTFDDFFRQNAPARRILFDALSQGIATEFGQKRVALKDRLFAEFQQRQQIAARQQLQRTQQEAEERRALRDDINRAQQIEFNRSHQLRMEELAAVAEGRKQEEFDMFKDIDLRLKTLEAEQKVVETDEIKQTIRNKRQQLKNLQRVGKGFGQTGDKSMFDALLLSVGGATGFEQMSPEQAQDFLSRAKRLKADVSRAAQLSGIEAQRIIDANKVPFDDYKELLREGNASLDRNDLSEFIGETNIPAFIKDLRQNQGVLIKNPNEIRGFNVKTAGQRASLRSFNQLKQLATVGRGLNARISRDDFKQDPEGTRQRLQGYVDRLKAIIGVDGVTSMLEAADAAEATSFARSGGEVGVLTDRDINRFLALVPSATDTHQELRLKDRFFQTKFLSGIAQVIEEQQFVGKRGEEKFDIDLSEVDENGQLLLLQEADARNQTIEEYMIDLFESGANFKIEGDFAELLGNL